MIDCCCFIYSIGVPNKSLIDQTEKLIYCNLLVYLKQNSFNYDIINWNYFHYCIILEMLMEIGRTKAIPKPDQKVMNKLMYHHITRRTWAEKTAKKALRAKRRVRCSKKP